MQNYKESLGHRFFVVTAGTLTDVTKTTADLAATQLGLFNPKKGYKALPVATSAVSVPEVIIAYGSPNTEVIPWTNAAESIKTTPIKAKNVVAFRKSSPKKPKNHVVAIGYNGIDDTKTIEAYCEETYSLFIQIEGSPASRFFGGKPYTELFVYETGCCPTSCEPVDPCDKPKVSAEKVVDYFVSEINNHHWMKNFVKAEKLVKYTAPPSLSTVTYTTYKLTIPDNGTAADLGKIQATYNSSVVRTERDGVKSTYELTLLGSAPAPAPFSFEGGDVFAVCDVCPDNYILVPEQTIYKIVIPDVPFPPGVDDLLQMLLLKDGVSGVTVWSQDEDGTVTLLLTGDADLDFEEIFTFVIDENELFLQHLVTVFGIKQAICTPDEDFEGCQYSWVEVGDCVKVKRNLTLTLGKDECGDLPTLEELTAYFAGFGITDISFPETDEDCGIVITAKQLSTNCIPVKDCGTVPAEYTTPEPYKGIHWEIVEPIANPENIEAIGIKLTGAYVNTEFGNCSWHYDDLVELDIPKIIVRQGNDTSKCKTAWPVTVLQSPEYPSGIGANVQKDYIEQAMFLHQCYSDDRRWREIMGYDYDFIERKKYYVLYYLTYILEDKIDKYMSSATDQRTTVTIAVEENDIAGQLAVENLLGSWINSVKPDLLDGNFVFNSYRP